MSHHTTAPAALPCGHCHAPAPFPFPHSAECPSCGYHLAPPCLGIEWSTLTYSAVPEAPLPDVSNIYPEWSCVREAREDTEQAGLQLSVAIADAERAECAVRVAAENYRAAQAYYRAIEARRHAIDLES